MEDKKKLYIAPPVAQLIQKSLAGYAVLDFKGLSYLTTSINVLRAVVGESKIKERYKERYEKIMISLDEFYKISNIISQHYDFLSKGDLKENNVFDKNYREFLESLKHLPLIHMDIIGLLIFLLDETELSDKSIPSNYFKEVSANMSFDPNSNETGYLTRKFRKDGENDDN